MVVAVVVSGMLVLPAGALGGPRSDDDDVRVTGTCSGKSRATMRVRADDGSLRVELRIDPGRAGPWNVVLLHERRIAFRGTIRARSSSGSVRLRRTVADWFGRDTLVARATGPRRETCRATATI